MALWPVKAPNGARPRRQGESITSGWENSRLLHKMHVVSTHVVSTLGYISANTQPTRLPSAFAHVTVFSAPLTWRMAPAARPEFWPAVGRADPAEDVGQFTSMERLEMPRQSSSPPPKSCSQLRHRRRSIVRGSRGRRPRFDTASNSQLDQGERSQGGTDRLAAASDF